MPKRLVPRNQADTEPVFGERRRLSMAKPRLQRSIRFSESEWNAVCEAAERRNLKPAEFVREAAADVAAREIDRDDSKLSPALIEMIERTFRGVHLLAYHCPRVRRCDWRTLFEHERGPPRWASADEAEDFQFREDALRGEGRRNFRRVDLHVGVLRRLVGIVNSRKSSELARRALSHRGLSTAAPSCRSCSEHKRRAARAPARAAPSTSSDARRCYWS